MSQTAYVVNQPIAYPGLIGDLAPNEVKSYTNKQGATVSFGVGMVLGTNLDTEAKLPASTGDVTNKFAGVLVHTHASDANSILGVAAVPDGEVVGLMVKGNIWVQVEESVTPTDGVFLRHTVSGPNNPGGWRKSADTATATQVTRAKWLTSASAAGFALLALSLP